MSEEEAVALVAKAIRAGIFNDLGSGSNVDVCIIRKDGVDYRRNMEFLQVRCTTLLPVQKQCPVCLANPLQLLMIKKGHSTWHVEVLPTEFVLPCRTRHMRG
jgi:hypothetical protein